MITRLERKGDNYLLEIDGKLMDSLRIDPKEPVELTAVDDVLVLTPVGQTDKSAKVEQAIAKIHVKYGEVMRRLAK